MKLGKLHLWLNSEAHFVLQGQDQYAEKISILGAQRVIPSGDCGEEVGEAGLETVKGIRQRGRSIQLEAVRRAAQ